MNKTPKRKVSENANIKSYTATAKKVKVTEIETETVIERTITRSYASSGQSSRASRDHEYLNANRNDIADRLESTSSHRLSIASPDHTSMDLNSEEEVEKPKRVRKSTAKKAAKEASAESPGNSQQSSSLLTSQVLQREWTEEANGIVRKRTNASASSAAGAVKPRKTPAKKSAAALAVASSVVDTQSVGSTLTGTQTTAYSQRSVHVASSSASVSRALGASTSSAVASTSSSAPLTQPRQVPAATHSAAAPSHSAAPHTNAPAFAATAAAAAPHHVDVNVNDMQRAPNSSGNYSLFSIVVLCVLVLVTRAISNYSHTSSTGSGSSVLQSLFDTPRNLFNALGDVTRDTANDHSDSHTSASSTSASEFAARIDARIAALRDVMSEQSTDAHYRRSVDAMLANSSAVDYVFEMDTLHATFPQVRASIAAVEDQFEAVSHGIAAVTVRTQQIAEEQEELERDIAQQDSQPPVYTVCDAHGDCIAHTTESDMVTNITARLQHIESAASDAVRDRDAVLRAIADDFGIEVSVAEEVHEEEVVSFEEVVQHVTETLQESIRDHEEFTETLASVSHTVSEVTVRDQQAAEAVQHIRRRSPLKSQRHIVTENDVVQEIERLATPLVEKGLDELRAELLATEHSEEQEEDETTAQDTLRLSGEGVVDYAAGPRGGRVADHRLYTSPYAEVDGVVGGLSGAARTVAQFASRMPFSALHTKAKNARATLTSHMPPQLNESYSFSGSEGRVSVILHAPIHVSAIELVYVYDTSMAEVGDSEGERNRHEHNSAAPRHISIIGHHSATLKDLAQPLGDFNFELPDLQETPAANHTHTHSQSFAVSPVTTLRGVTVQVHSNHGNGKVTRLYRVRVLGELLE